VAGIDPLTGVATPAAAATVTYRSLELLAATLSLPNKVFRCRSAPGGGPIARADALATSDAWGRGTVAYACDWAAPTDCVATRVLIADRSSEHHRDVVMTASADGHVGSLRTATTPLSAGAGVCEGAIRGAANPDALGTDLLTGGNADATAPDDIYTGAKDARDGSDRAASVAGGGSPRRAWVQ
jgi:hypothetical protein